MRFAVGQAFDLEALLFDRYGNRAYPDPSLCFQGKPGPAVARVQPAVFVAWLG